MENIKQIKHLFARAAFGMRLEEMQHYTDITAKKAVKGLFNNAADYEPITVTTNNSDYNVLMGSDVSAKKMFLKAQRDEEKELNIAWINKMSTTGGPLLEKMGLFWNNHFACRALKANHAGQLLNIQRKNALGNFREMLIQVSQSPAMLQFLNNQQNHKGHPNENFARELMELFTIGRGNYTEQDVKESARAFTGWGFDKDNDEFKMRYFLHDTGQKTFMGQTGNFEGADIINILLQKKETARFICNKLYKYLVNETPDPGHVNTMADVFFNANYEIKPLLEHVFTADWFYDDKNTGNIIKSPVDLLVGLNRQFYITYQKPAIILLFQQVLGQVLFNPPNVAGWPGGRNWIDSSSLMNRIKLPSTILNGGVIDIAGKTDPEDEAYIAATHRQQQFVVTRVESQPNWNKFLAAVPANTSNITIAQFLLEPALSSNLQKTLNESTDLKNTVIEIVSTPEYQLC